MAYVLPTLVAMGFGYFVTETSLRAAADRAALGLDWLRAGRDRHGDGGRAGRDRPRLGALHLLPAADRQPVLLHRRRAGRGRLVDLGRADVAEPLPLETRQSRQAVPLADVRDQSPAPISGAGPPSARRSSCCSRSSPWRSASRSTIDAGLARVFFSWTLHAIVYFWLMPTYIAYYTIVPRAIGGRLFSDPMGRIAFILFLVVAMPIGIHHLFEDPEVGAGFKYPAFGVHRLGRAADAADRVHDLRVGRDRRPAARRQRRAGLADGAAVAQPDHARGRRSPSSCSVSAAPAGSST